VAPELPPSAQGTAQQGAQGGAEEVAQYLAMAWDAILRAGPTPDVAAAIQQFLELLKQLIQGVVPQKTQSVPLGQGAPGGGAAPPPAGGPGTPPILPPSPTPLPPRQA
jgi:hypothetical protein